PDVETDVEIASQQANQPVRHPASRQGGQLLQFQLDLSVLLLELVFLSFMKPKLTMLQIKIVIMVF
ncbi:Calcium-dependent protein kinase 16, partial [Bienertia sinuspersici]